MSLVPLAARADGTPADEYRTLEQLRIQPEFSPEDSRRAVAAIGSADAMVRTAGAELLLQHLPAPPEALPVLAKLVQTDASPATRGTAAAVLAGSGAPAFDLLKQLLLGPDLRVRQTAATAVRALNPVPEALKPLVEWASPPLALTGPSLHPNSGFEAGLLGWEFSQEDGGTGRAEIDSNYSRSGHQSLRLTKTNGLGYLRLKSTYPIRLSPSTANTVLRGWFHAEDAPIGAQLFFRLRNLDGSMAAKDLIRLGDTQQGQTYLRNSPAKVWEKRLLQLAPSTQEREYFVEVTYYGNPGSVWLDDIDFPATPANFFITDPVPSIPVQSAPLAVPQTTPATAEIKYEGGRAQLFVDGKPTPPILHLPLPSDTGDFTTFEAAGVRLQTVLVEFNDYTGDYGAAKGKAGSLPSAWPSTNGPYRFEESIRRVARAAAQAPNSRLIIGFHVSWPRDYVKFHPESLWMNAKGEKAYGNTLFFKGFASELKDDEIWWPSPYLDQPVEDAGKVISAFVQELKKTPYGNRVAGFFISGGHDGQFYIGERDFSPAATASFREFLRSKYKTDAGLAEAWKRPGLTFESVNVEPERTGLNPNPAYSNVFIDPAREGDQHDYEEFRTTRMWRVKEMLIAAAKTSLGRPSLGLTWNLGGAIANNMQPFLHSKFLDACIVQPNYADRMPGLGGGITAADRSMALHRKLVIKELDTRSWLRETYADEAASMKISTPMSLDQFHKLFWKEAGESIANDEGWWHFDISSNAFRHPAIMAEIGRAQQVYSRVQAAPRSFHPEVAVIYSHEGYLWSRNAGGRRLPQWCHEIQEREIQSSGVPVDRYYLDDFIQTANLSQYKVIIMMNAYWLSAAERQFIETKLKFAKRTIIWHYGIGCLGEDGASAEALSKLTGMRVVTDLEAKRVTAAAVPGNDPLAKNLQPSLGVLDSMRRQYLTDDKLRWYDVQRFAINDPQATTLAKYTADNQPAIAVRRFPTWTSLYVGALGSLSGELLNNAAKEAGAYTVTTPGQIVVDMNDHFISVHALRSGSYTLRLPRTATVIDVETGKPLPTVNQAFTVKLEAQESRWFELR